MKKNIHFNIIFTDRIIYKPVVGNLLDHTLQFNDLKPVPRKNRKYKTIAVKIFFLHGNHTPWCNKLRLFNIFSEKCYTISSLY